MWLHSLKVAQLLRSAACLHTNQSRSFLNHLVFVGSKRQAFLVFLLSFLLYLFGIRHCPRIAAVRYYFQCYSPFVTIILSSWLSWEVSGRRLVVGYRRFGTRFRSLRNKHILTSTRLLIRVYERNTIKLTACASLPEDEHLVVLETC